MLESVHLFRVFRVFRGYLLKKPTAKHTKHTKAIHTYEPQSLLDADQAFNITSMTKHVRELFDLTGKSAIVTGGSRGIGKEMAEGLAEAGSDLMLCARRAEWLDETVEEFRTRGFNVEGMLCDVAKPEQVEA